MASSADLANSVTFECRGTVQQEQRSSPGERAIYGRYLYRHTWLRGEAINCRRPLREQIAAAGGKPRAQIDERQSIEAAMRPTLYFELGQGL